jgi:hypothetical protein
MPFKKVAKNTYKSPSGRKMTKAQVIAYYAKKDQKSTKNGKKR